MTANDQLINYASTQTAFSRIQIFCFPHSLLDHISLSFVKYSILSGDSSHKLQTTARQPLDWMQTTEKALLFHEVYVKSKIYDPEMRLLFGLLPSYFFSFRVIINCKTAQFLNAMLLALKCPHKGWAKAESVHLFLDH